jgi:hypothetical protein
MLSTAKIEKGIAKRAHDHLSAEIGVVPTANAANYCVELNV